MPDSKSQVKKWENNLARGTVSRPWAHHKGFLEDVWCQGRGDKGRMAQSHSSERRSRESSAGRKNRRDKGCESKMSMARRWGSVHGAGRFGESSDVPFPVL